MDQQFAEVWQSRFPDARIFPTPTGRHALWYFLNLVKLEPGSEVLIQAYNYYVVVRLLIQMGLKPVFVDIEPDSLCMDANDLKRKIGPKCKMVLVTHMFGNPADLDPISQIARENNLLLFEDCAHAVGSTYKGKQVGNWGDGALLSFGIMKSLSSFGGGMLVLGKNFSGKFTHPKRNLLFGAEFFGHFVRFVFSIMLNPFCYGWTHYRLNQLAVFLASKGVPFLRTWLGTSKNAPNYRFSINDNSSFKPFMTKMHIMQLKRLEEDNAKRRHAVQYVSEKVADIEQITPILPHKNGLSNCSYFGLYVQDKELISKFLKRRGVDNHPYEYFDCSTLEQFSEYAGVCPHAQYASNHVLRLPSYPGLSPKQLDKIIAALRKFYQQ